MNVEPFHAADGKYYLVLDDDAYAGSTPAQVRRRSLPRLLPSFAHWPAATWRPSDG